MSSSHNFRNSSRKAHATNRDTPGSSSDLNRQNKQRPRRNRQPALIEQENRTAASFDAVFDFLGQLPIDVRRMIYDYLIIPPFSGAAESRGLYMSCRGVYQELQDVGAILIRKRLLELEQELKANAIDLLLPSELQAKPVPVLTKLNLRVLIKDTDSRTRPQLTQALEVFHHLTFLRIDRIHIHFDERDLEDSHIKTRYANNELMAAQIIKGIVTHDAYEVGGGWSRPRVREIIVSWRSRIDGQVPSLGYLKGTKYEFGNYGPRQPHALRFWANDQQVGARVAVIPTANSEEGIFKTEELLNLYRSNIDKRFANRRTNAMMEFLTAEIRQG